MGKLAQSTIKYLIEAKFTTNGIVEKPDIIGAIFGQTEGLLGQDLDLRELQRTGRIGRIEVKTEEKDGKTQGLILIPSSLDASETVLIAAAIETIERIGPCESEIKLKSVKDIRAVKRDYVVQRAKTILGKLLDEQMPQTTELATKIKNSVRTAEITDYKGLPAGPDIRISDEVIFVEGRADVLNLLKSGIKNAVAVGGTTIHEPIKNLSKRKTSIVFLDGDRGGDLILKKLLKTANIDFVARAPKDKEVEELSKKEIFKSLRDKLPVEQYVSSRKKTKSRKRSKSSSQSKENLKLNDKTKKKIKTILDKMVGTKAAYMFDNSMKLKGKVPLKKFNKKNKYLKETDILLIDGKIDKKIIEICDDKDIKYLVANESDKKYEGKKVEVLTQKDLS